MSRFDILRHWPSLPRQFPRLGPSRMLATRCCPGPRFSVLYMSSRTARPAQPILPVNQVVHVIRALILPCLSSRSRPPDPFRVFQTEPYRPDSLAFRTACRVSSVFLDALQPAWPPPPSACIILARHQGDNRSILQLIAGLILGLSALSGLLPLLPLAFTARIRFRHSGWFGLFR
jgi:hypothetical protein